MRSAITVCTAAFMLFSIGGSPRRASAQSESGAQSLLIDPSIRASAMGGASTAVIWGGDPNYWANPALLPYQHGIRYERGRTHLVPDLSPKVSFKTKRLLVGYGGVTISLAGKPLGGVGSQRLNYGTSEATDVDGNPIGTFTSYEDIESFGIGLSPLEMARTVGLAFGIPGFSSITRYGDVSIGRTTKTTDVFLAPASVTLDGRDARAKVTTYDSGVLFRATPYNSIDYPGIIPGVDRIAAVRVDVTHGRSTQNYNDARISYSDPTQADPVARISRRGWASRMALDLPGELRRHLRAGVFGWALDFVTPLISWSKAWDRMVPTVHDLGTGSRMERTRVVRTGWELAIANSVSIRRGRVDDPENAIHGRTSGWGLGLNWGDAAGVRFDRATVPQSDFLTTIDRDGLTVYADPIRLRQKIRPTGEPSSRGPARVGLATFGGYQTYSMSDVNEAIASPGNFFPGGTAETDDIKGGGGYGLGLRLWPSERILLSFDGSRLLAKTTGSAVFAGTPYGGELSVPATAITGTVSYIFPVSDRLGLGVGAGGGYYVSSGKATATGSGQAYSSELNGSGLGFHALGVADIPLTHRLHAEIGAGYRRAKTTDVELAGATLHNADGSKSQIDWSGFMSKAGLTIYFGHAPSGAARPL